MGDRIMASVLANVHVHGLEAVLIAVSQVLDSGAPSAEHILNVLTRLKPATIPAQVSTSLTLLEELLANTARYDSLNVQEVNHA